MVSVQVQIAVPVDDVNRFLYGDEPPETEPQTSEEWEGIEVVPSQDGPVYQAGLFDGGLRERLAALLLAPFKAFLKRRAMEAGATEEEVDRKFAELGDGTLLKLLFENWDKVLQLILALLGRGSF